MRLLITGGLGYVGGRLVAHLTQVEPDWKVRILTTRSADRVPRWAREVELVPGDVRDPAATASAVDGVDAVVHLAAVNETVSGRDIELAIDVNVTGTLRILEACSGAAIGRFVYFSTVHVYGQSAPNPIREETATRPAHPYAFTHRAPKTWSPGSDASEVCGVSCFGSRTVTVRQPTSSSTGGASSSTTSADRPSGTAVSGSVRVAGSTATS